MGKVNDVSGPPKEVEVEIDAGENDRGKEEAGISIAGPITEEQRGQDEEKKQARKEEQAETKKFREVPVVGERAEERCDEQGVLERDEPAVAGNGKHEADELE
jgi:hypothetical protein